MNATKREAAPAPAIRIDRLRDIFERLAIIAAGVTAETAPAFRSAVDAEIEAQVAERVREIESAVDKSETAARARKLLERRDAARANFSRKTAELEQLEAKFHSSLAGDDDSALIQLERLMSEAASELRTINKRCDFLAEQADAAEKALRIERKRARDELADTLRTEAAEELKLRLAAVAALIEAPEFRAAIQAFQVASRRDGAFQAEKAHGQLVDCRAEGLRFWSIDDLMRRL